MTYIKCLVMLVMLNIVFASFDDSDEEGYSRAYAADKNDTSDISDDDKDNEICKAPKAIKRKTHRRDTVGNPIEEAHMRSGGFCLGSKPTGAKLAFTLTKQEEAKQVLITLHSHLIGEARTNITGIIGLLDTNVQGAITQLKAFPTSGDIGISMQIENALHILGVGSEKSCGIGTDDDGKEEDFDSADIEEC